MFNWNTSGSSSFGRASAFQAEGGRFEPGLPLYQTGGIKSQFKAAVAQLVECVLGKDEVTGSNPVVGSKKMIKIEILITHYLTIK